MDKTTSGYFRSLFLDIWDTVLRIIAWEIPILFVITFVASFSSWGRLIMFFLSLGIYMKLFWVAGEKAGYKRYDPWNILKIIMIVIPVIIFVPWLCTSTKFSCPYSDYQLPVDSKAFSPFSGASIKYTGGSLLVKSSYHAKEVYISTDENKPKSIGISILGDRAIVRYHVSTSWGGTGAGIRVIYDTRTGEELWVQHVEGGYWHGVLYVIL